MSGGIFAQSWPRPEKSSRASRPRAPHSIRQKGCRYLSRLTRTALNMLVDSADPDFPRLFLLCDDKIKIGADNPDNLYQQCVVNPTRTYRITGKRNTVPYFRLAARRTAMRLTARWRPPASSNSTT
jgi:hypothetical protein